MRGFFYCFKVVIFNSLLIINQLPMNNAVNFLKNHNVVVIIIICTTFFFTDCLRNHFISLSNDAITPLECVYEMNREKLITNKNLPIDLCNTLVHKVDVLETKKAHHKEIFMVLYKNYYAVVSVFPFLSGILVLLTFLILQKGWSNITNKYIKPLFLTFSLLTAIYGLFPVIYQQEEMISKNTINFIALSKLQKQIFDYGETRFKLYDSLYKSDMDFINHINKKEQDLYNLFYDLELKGVDKDLFSGIK